MSLRANTKQKKSVNLPRYVRAQATIHRRGVHIAYLISQKQARTSLGLKQLFTGSHKSLLYVSIKVRVFQFDISKSWNNQKVSITWSIKWKRCGTVTHQQLVSKSHNFLLQRQPHCYSINKNLSILVGVTKKYQKSLFRYFIGKRMSK